MKSLVLASVFACVVTSPRDANFDDASQARCPTPQIEVEEGGDVFLPCHLDPSSDVSGQTVDWKRDDLNSVVHAYRQRRDDADTQMVQFSNRTSLNHEDLSRGILTLHISSVQLSDSGPYKCFVPQLQKSCIVRLTVVTKGQSDGSRSDYFNTTTLNMTDPSDSKKQKRVPAVIAPILVIILLILIGALAWSNSGRIQRCWRRSGGEMSQRELDEREHFYESRNPNGAGNEDKQVVH